MQKKQKKTDYTKIGVAVAVALWLCAVIGTDSRVRTESDSGVSRGTQSISVSGHESTKSEDVADSKTETQSKTDTYQVVSVVDGDTIKVNYDGKTTSVRLIGVNTPETVDPRKDVECFGQEASQFLKNQLEGKTVTLEADSTQSDRDKYNRLLRYVYLDGKDVNLMLIESGYGYEYTYNVPYAKQAQYKSAQTAASNNKRGLWADGVCAKNDSMATTTTAAAAVVTTSSTASTTTTTTTTNTAKPVTTTTTTTKPQQTTKPASTTTAPKPATTTTNASTAPNQNCNIKGNINSKKEKIYHMPGQRNYDDTVIDTSKGERWFCTEQEAINAGWRKAKR